MKLLKILGKLAHKVYDLLYAETLVSSHHDWKIFKGTDYEPTRIVGRSGARSF